MSTAPDHSVCFPNPPAMADRAKEARTRLIRQLAEFIAKDQGGKSVALQMEDIRGVGDGRPKLAHEWAMIRDAARIRGYISVDEAEAQLTRLFSP